MNPDNRFDPFNNRLCRDVRNTLGETFKSSIKKRDSYPVARVAGKILGETLPPWVSDYVNRRLSSYTAVLATLAAKNITDPIDVSLAIWAQGLFFEAHEFLEPYWMAADGKEKLLLQALIRAAGSFVHLEQGNLGAAKRIAGKAIVGLCQVKDLLARHTDPERLIDSLKNLDGKVPTLLMAGMDSQASSNG